MHPLSFPAMAQISAILLHDAEESGQSTPEIAPWWQWGKVICGNCFRASKWLVVKPGRLYYP